MQIVFLQHAVLSLYMLSEKHNLRVSETNTMVFYAVTQRERNYGHTTSVAFFSIWITITEDIHNNINQYHKICDTLHGLERDKNKGDRKKERR